jgi:hypothetical protein
VHAEGPAQQEQQQEQPGPGQQAQKKKKQEQAEQQQGPQHYAQLVAHGWAHGIVVWNLLTGNVSWFCSLPVCSAAADPVHPVFAVGVPAVLDHSSSSSSSHAGSDEAADGQQQQQSERQQGLVLVFGDKQAEPLYACTVPDSSPSSLLFWPGKAAAAPAGADSAAARVSPLMLLTQDRRYTRVNLGGSSSSSSSDGSAAAAAEAEAAVQGTKAALAAEAAANGEGRSALESMFGKTEAPAATAAAADGSSAAAAAAAVKAAVSQLFDAPSHVLPAPSSLCPTLLDLLIGAGQQGSR